jgi:hypothetical protein
VSSLVVDDGDSAIAARPDAVGPVMKTGDPFGDVGIHELHEQGKLLGARRGYQQVRVIGDDYEGVEGHLVGVLGLADDTENEVVELWGRPKQEPALKSAGGNLDEGVVGDEAKRP